MLPRMVALTQSAILAVGDQMDNFAVLLYKSIAQSMEG